MALDLGTIQYNVEADTEGLDKGNAALDKFEQNANSAAVATDNLGKKVDVTAKVTTQAAKANDEAARSAKNLGNLSRQAGFQIQDAVVQLQGGAAASLVFAQQGSQLLSVLHPMLGLAAALGGVLSGVLVASLNGSSAATDGLSESILKLHKEYADLDVFQKQFLANEEVKKQKEIRDEIARTQLELNKLTDAYEKASLASGKPSYSSIASVGSDQASIFAGQDIKNAEDALIATRAKLSTETDKLAESDKELKRIRGESVVDVQQLTKQANDLVVQLKDQAAHYSLSGEALARYTANKYKAAGAISEEIYQLSMLAEQAKQKQKDDQKAKSDADQKARSIDAYIDRLEKQNITIANTSEVAKNEAEISNGVLRGATEAVIAHSRALALQNDVKREAIALDKEINKAHDDYINTYNKETESIAEEVKRQREANEEIGKTKDQVNALRLARIDNAIAIEQEAVAAAMAAPQWTKEAEAHAERLKQLNQKRAVVAEGGILEQQDQANKEFAKSQEKMWDRVDDAAANVYENILDGSKSAFDGMKSIFNSTLAEMAHQALSKPILLNFQQSISGTGGGAGLASIGTGGLYAAAAIATVSAINSWNKRQEEQIKEFTAEYRQGVQSTGTILGDANAKSDSISQSSDKLVGLASDTLNVNYGMYKTLIDIRAGITGAASQVARSGINEPSVSGLGTTTNDLIGKTLLFGAFSPVTSLIGGEVGGFIDGVVNSVSKAIYSKSKKVIDSGIKFTGETLADILESGTVSALSYATVQTKKKFIGVTTSNKVKDQTGDLSDELLRQFGLVFESGGSALEEAAKSFGLDFDNYINQLVIDPQKLSLKGLTGDALTEEIEKFFSSTLDNWAGVLTDGTGVLEQFQQSGEGAFETVVRLATEVNTFSDYADKLNLNFNLVGVAAINATENIADAAGGFDTLSSALSSYYDKYFSDEEKLANLTKQFTEATGGLLTTLPTSKAAFRSVIESIDLTTESGEKAFASLIQLNPVFDQIISLQEETAKSALAAQEESAKSALSALQKSVDAQKKILKTQTDAAEKAVNTTQSIVDDLRGTLNGLTITSTANQAISRAAAQQQLMDMKVNGIDEEKLKSALATISNPSENLFSTFQEYADDFYATASLISDLEKSATGQLTNEEKVLDELNKQNEALDQTVEWARAQVDGIDTVNSSVLSVADAINNLSVGLGVAPTAVATPPAISAVNQSSQQGNEISELKTMLKDLYEIIKSSQIAIADNTLKTYKVLDKFDAIGMPPEREEADA